MKSAAFFLLAIGVLQVSGFGQALGPLGAPPFAVGPVAREEAERQRQAQIHAKWNVCVDLQMVALDEAEALELLPHLRSEDQKEVDEAWVRLQAMIKAGRARLMAWPMVKTVDGARAVSETILEKRYPTEFEPPQEPRTFGPPEPKPGHINAQTVESTSNAIETRDIRVTLEVEPTVLNDGKRVYLRLVPLRMDLLGMEDFGHALTIHNTLVPAPQPLFLSLKSDLTLFLQSGQRQLIAVHKLTKPANFLEFHLIRATVSKAE